MKKNIYYGILVMLLLLVVAAIINPRLGSYTIQADVCPVANPEERPLRLLFGESLLQVKLKDKPSNNPLMGCYIQAKYVQYLR